MAVRETPDVFSASEIAQAAGVSEPLVRALIAGGDIRTIGGDRGAPLVTHDEARRVVRALRGGERVAASDGSGLARLLTPLVSDTRGTTIPLLLSTSLHVAAVAALLVIGAWGLTSAEERTDPLDSPAEPIRLVYLALPGPGGGGGGGGLRMPTPATQAQRQGPRRVSSPLPARRLPPPPAPEPKPEPPPPPLEARVLPPVVAPVAPIAADAKTQEGVLQAPPAEAPVSQGSGTRGGSGLGTGTGLGEGTGAGIGEGEGGGMGGGPYRAGSGVEPPRLLREVRADYTDEARRANVAGEVVLEIVVRRDGSVGDVRVLRRLGSGLDQRAIDAVRQWRFAPARLKGAAVDVIVEVAVEFKLR